MNVLPELLVTWIAPVLPLPAQPLKWLEELGKISKIQRVNVRVLTGEVLLNDVSNVLGFPAHAVIFSGHGKPRGLALSDGTFIQPQWFASQVKKSVVPRLPFLAVLAACSSNEGSLDLPSMAAVMCRKNITTIGMPADIGDAQAAKFTIELIRAFVTESIGDAFDVARESIAGQPLSNNIFLMAGLDPRPRYVAADMDAMLSALARIEDRLEIHSQDAPDMPVTREAEHHQGGIQPLTRSSGQGNIIGLSAAEPQKADATTAPASTTPATAAAIGDLADRANDVADMAGEVTKLATDVATEVAAITKPAE